MLRALTLQLLVLCAIQAIRPMITYRALDLGASAAHLGAIAAAFGLLSFVAAVPAGRLIDRHGPTRFVVGGAVLLTLTALWLTFIEGLFALAVSQALLGLGHIVGLIAMQTIFAGGGEVRHRDQRMSLFTFVVSIGQVVGPAAAGFISGAAGGAVRPVFVVAAIAMASAVALAIGLHVWAPPLEGRDAPDAEDTERPSAGKAVGTVLRIPGVPHAMVASLTVLAAIDLVTIYLPAYGAANGIPVQTVGVLLALRGLTSVAARGLMLPLLRLVGRRHLLIASVVSPGLVLGLLPLTTSPVVLGAMMLVAGVGLGLGQPLTLVWVANRVPPSLRATAFAVRLSGNRLGQLAVPAAVGLVAGAASVTSVFVVIGVMLGASGLLVTRAELGDDPLEDAS